MIPIPQTYRDRLYPWCVIRYLPNLRRLIVARFRGRNDAEEYFKVIKQMLPDAQFAIAFETIQEHERERVCEALRCDSQPALHTKLSEKISSNSADASI